MLQRLFRNCFAWIIFAAPVISYIIASNALAQEGTLSTIRQDVREGPPASESSSNSSPPQEASNNRRHYQEENISDDAKDQLFCFTGTCLGIAGLAITSPIWTPYQLLGDDLGNRGYFLHYPYDGASGYLRTFELPEQYKPYAVRFDVEYVETFDRLDILGGHLLVETAPRFGLDASFNHIEERLSGGRRDALQIGDCNLVYRFAQSEWAEFRTGLGLNWLNDSRGAVLGFNFTYAADFYLRKPWILSTAIDWGTLGHVELFRFRTTAGVVFHGVETYAGYEYTDIGRTHWNGLIAGLRFWF